MGHLRASAVIAVSAFKALGPRVSEGERDGRMGTEGDGNAISSRSHLAEIGWGMRGTAADGGARAGNGAGEGEQGSSERLTPAASAFRGGGWRVDGVNGVEEPFKRL